MSNPRPHRTKDEWYALIQECRKSGMTDAQWCLANGISRHTFNNAIKHLRNCAYAIPSKKPRDIYDLTCPAQDVKNCLPYHVKISLPDYVKKSLPYSVKFCLPYNVKKSLPCQRVRTKSRTNDKEDPQRLTFRVSFISEILS